MLSLAVFYHLRFSECVKEMIGGGGSLKIWKREREREQNQIFVRFLEGRRIRHQTKKESAELTDGARCLRYKTFVLSHKNNFKVQGSFNIYLKCIVDLPSQSQNRPGEKGRKTFVISAVRSHKLSLDTRIV